jgi:hypothetical protein
MAKVEEVTIQTSDIEFIRDTLTNLYSFCISHDLQDQYRRLDDRGSTSALTIQTEDALTKAKAAAALAGEPDPEPLKSEPQPNPIREENVQQ